MPQRFSWLWAIRTNMTSNVLPRPVVRLVPVAELLFCFDWHCLVLVRLQLHSCLALVLLQFLALASLALARFQFLGRSALAWPLLGPEWS